MILTCFLGRRDSADSRDTDSVKRGFHGNNSFSADCQLIHNSKLFLRKKSQAVERNNVERNPGVAVLPVSIRPLLQCYTAPFSPVFFELFAFQSNRVTINVHVIVHSILRKYFFEIPAQTTQTVK